MIFQRAAIREFTHTAAAVFVALFAILMTTQLIRLLGDAAGGRLASEAVIALLGFRAITYLPVLLSLTLFIAVLMTLSRWYRDSEMVVWLSSGIPLTTWIRPVLKFVGPPVVVIAILSLLLAPWAMQKSEAYRQTMDQRDDVARVSPGAFNESAAADRVFFVESMTGDEGKVKNIFISSIQQGRLGVMATAQGHTDNMPNGDRFLVLDRGRRYESTAGTAEYRVMEFDRYALRIETKEARGLEESPRTKPIWELVRDPQAQNLAEFLWRLGLPLAALNLAVLAIPLSYVNPRAGRTNNLIFALLTYMIYSNLLSVSQAWVAQGKLRFEIGVWAVHVGMFLLLIVLFYRRQNPLAWGKVRWR
jgi:lipopolysaccharide export system permease protein